jgi:hypothetical protein
MVEWMKSVTHVRRHERIQNRRLSKSVSVGCDASRAVDRLSANCFIEDHALNMNDRTLGKLRAMLEDDTISAVDRLRHALRMTASHRAHLVGNTLVHHGGLKVRTGPFAGMVIPNRASEGCFVPKLLGCYEAELHPVIDHIRDRGYSSVVNIGCAEGYYAVGLARLLPNGRIWAYDTDEKARTVCALVAEENSVSDRITFAGTFGHRDFEGFPAGDTVVICDIEGAECDLLDPEKAPALAGFDIQVELHNRFEAPFNQELLERFSSTHDIRKILPSTRNIEAYPELRDLEHLDQLISFWEFRRGPNPWLFMTTRDL